MIYSFLELKLYVMNIINNNIFKITLLTLFLSLSLIYNHNFDFWTNKEYTYYQLFLTLFFSTIFLLTSKEKLIFGKVDLSIILILLFVIISRFIQLKSINEIHIINTFSLIMYYVSVKTIRLNTKETHIYFQIISAIGVVLSIYCYLELFDKIERTNYYWKLTGNFPNPGPLGGFIAIISTLTFYQLLQKDILKSPSKLVFLVLASAIMLSVLIKSASRAALLSTVISITFLVSYYGFKKWKSIKYIIISLLPILPLIIISKGTDSIEGRLLIWKIAFLSFWDHPLMGIGYNFFKVEYLNFQANYFSTGGTVKEILLAGPNLQAFNEFLKFILENGILGIILIIVLSIWIFKTKSFQGFQKENFSLATTGVYLSFGIFAFFSFPLQFLPFKLLLLNQIALQHYTPLTYQIKINENTKKIAFGLGSVLLFFIVTKQYNGFHAWKNASEEEYTNPDSSKILYEYAEKQLNNDGNFLFCYGNFLEKTNIDAALSLYDKAKKINNMPILYAKTANLYERKLNFKSAENDLLKLHFIQPHVFKPQEKLLEFYIRTNNVKKAKLFAKKILKSPVKISSNEVSLIKKNAENYLK